MVVLQMIANTGLVVWVCKFNFDILGKAARAMRNDLVGVASARC
jgi:hypothetical protein